MSEYCKVKTHIDSREDLTAALQELGVKFEVGEDLELTGHWGRHSSREMRSAEIAIRRETLSERPSNDIGYRKGADGCYELVIVDVDEYRLRDFVNRVAQRAARHKALRQARRLGYAVVSQRQAGQVLQLELRRM